MSFRERVENNAVVFFLTALVTGFLTGVGTYEAILRLAQLQVVPQTRFAELLEGDKELQRLRETNARLMSEHQSDATSQLVGSWSNDDPNTGGITRFQFAKLDDQIQVHAWGKCHPTDCDWGVQRALLDGESFVVVWDEGFVMRKMTMNINLIRKLTATTESVYSDSRPRRRSDETFVKSKP